MNECRRRERREVIPNGVELEIEFRPGHTVVDRALLYVAQGLSEGQIIRSAPCERRLPPSLNDICNFLLSYPSCLSEPQV